MKLTIKKKWKWLGVDEDGESCLFFKKPYLVKDGRWRVWTTNRISRFKHFEGVIFIFDVPEQFALYKRVGEDWIKQKINSSKCTKG